ncbi:murein hydrolase activator EnvC family protein [Variovorax saccharolyticus]|uniref:murein hydrolase activator EnvC family protein n=1 Tax=Variovorax saccharolyticus TaxID=3053516 RepID=UPI0025789C1B|nr:M23 family metallopeptidase [Variovorax sp. J31P216]MDM0024780.1 M23 family metallopeptidase [Variovorax sp. J31P216]
MASVKPDRSYQRPASGAVVSRFDGRSNKGVDFAGAKGDPVRAAGDGKVVFAAATLRGYGRLVMIKHDATYMSAYAHNSELLVKEGQAVKRGQVIARMGDTESATVKLHFELRRNGSAIDPMPFFAASGAAAGTADD